MISWFRNAKRKVQPFRFAVITFAMMAAFVFTTNLRSANQYALLSQGISRASRISPKTAEESGIDKFWNLNMFSDADSEAVTETLMTYHPFNNTCKFPIPNIYAEDVIEFRLSERMRRLKCPVASKDYASMDTEGYMYVHPHFVDYPRVENDVKCKVDIIEGGLRQPKINMTKNIFRVVKSFDAPQDERFFVNANAFIVKCFNTSKKATRPDIPIWSKPYPGMKDSNLPENEILRVKDLQSYGDYGNKLRPEEKKPAERYSVDILGFDSTARTMFMRHMPRTVETMEKLGYHFLYGYTKVADNSMVNLSPILVGDIPAALKKPKHDDSGDININWILPTEDQMDPTDLNFLWKVMKEKYGCKSLFNEDISGKTLGLFNYPPTEFQAGFREDPAEHYYRAYYLAVYENWKYSACRDAEQIQAEFVSIWRRFAHRYKDICHFGFTFVTTLTHEAGFALELLDEKLSSHLSEMSLNGDLDNTLSVILGDHGNRIGAVQRRYTGRIEERMPLMAIRLPTGFAEKYPEEYQNFLDNKFKMTSNFDVHQMLHDIVHMRLGKSKSSEDTGRGISLFEEIPNSRSCYDANIPENFCMCMVDVANITKPLPNFFKKPVVDQKKDQFDVLKSWLNTEKLEECVDVTSLETEGEFKQIAINPFSRFGLRTKKNVTANAIVLKKHAENPDLNFINFEFPVVGVYKNNEPLRFLVRTELFVEKNTSSLVFEPMVQDAPSLCRFVSIFDVCQCLSLRFPANSP